MKLTDIRPESWMYLERYVDDKTYSPFSTYSAVSESYRPDGETPSFDLPYFLLDQEMTTVHANQPVNNVRLNSLLVRDDKCIFYVHPEVLLEQEHMQWDDVFLQKTLAGRTPDGYVKAIPTSSTRTVYLPDHDVFIKLHLPKRISRFQRRVHEPHISQNIKIMADLLPRLDGSYGVLPDIAGVFQNTTKWGYLIRDAIPTTYADDQKPIIMPTFSLYGIDQFNPSDEPLLTQMIKESGSDPIEFTADLVRKIISAWWDVYAKVGGLVDPHGQNVLISLTLDYKIDKVILRDFYAIDIDNVYRQKIGLTSFSTSMDAADRGGIGPVLSNTYDYHFGHHMLDFISRCLQTSFHISEDDLVDKVESIFANVVDTSVFPAEAYQYANRTFVGGQEELEKSDEPPKWR